MSPKEPRTEADARIAIDRLLREAHWNPENKQQVSTEEPAADGRADYLLKDRRGRGVAIVEAKRFAIDPVSAKNQAREYAAALGVPFVFLSNGEDIYFWDHEHRPEQKVATFYSQIDLEKLIALRASRKPLSVIPMSDAVFAGGETKTVRPYQREALEALDRAIESGKRKMLIVMATGTGKTMMIALQLKRMFDAGLAERVLFLVDRIELGKQAQESFNDILKDYPSELLFGGKRRREASITIGTLPTIYSQLNRLTSGYFDVVVSDEAHRSIYHIYKAVLTYFDAIRIGLTATPSMYVDRNTYKLFDAWDWSASRGQPLFVYGIRQGIREGYLAGYDIVRVDTKVSTEGLTYEGEDYNPEDLERRINVPARNERIAQSYRQEEEKREPKRHRKAIVFAITQNHAAQLAYYLNQTYPEFGGRFAEVITSNVQNVDQAIARFKKEEFPYVAVSVGMLDVGFDAPKVENLLMIRPTKSPTLYQQMRGRGSRLCPEIGKRSFRMYDFVGVTRAFNDDSFNPHSEVASHRKGIPWGTEAVELTEEELQDPEVKNRTFVRVPEAAPENIDLVVRREYVEVGPKGEKIDVDDYQKEWEAQVQSLIEKEPLLQKIRSGDELTDEEVIALAEKLNSPEFYFNEANLRAAYRYPEGTLSEFVRAALDLQELPSPERSRETRINDLFEAWLLEKNFASEQAKVLRMLKSQYLANKEIADASIFNRPLFRQLGGLSNVLRLFGEKGLPEILTDLNERVFEENHHG